MTYHAVLFLTAVVVVAPCRSRRGAVNLVAIVGVGPVNLISRLIDLLVGGIQICLILVVAPVVVEDIVGGAIGLEQRLLLVHLHVRRNTRADGQ